MARRRAAHAMAYVTAPDRATARDIARAVLDRRLAACANLWPVESVYRWHGKREETNEFVIVFKTRAELLPKLIGVVRRLHPISFGRSSARVRSEEHTSELQSPYDLV